MAEANEDSTAYLVHVDDEADLEGWLEVNGVNLFEEELNSWYTDPYLWPGHRSVALFKKWGTLELTRFCEMPVGLPSWTTKRELSVPRDVARHKDEHMPVLPGRSSVFAGFALHADRGFRFAASTRRIPSTVSSRASSTRPKGLAAC